MTSKTEYISAVQDLNAHVSKMFDTFNTRMDKETGTSIIENLDDQEVLMLSACIAQVSRAYCVLMHNHVPEEKLTKLDKYKIDKTIEVCDDEIKQCTSSFKGTVEHFTRDYDDDDEEKTLDDSINMHLASLRAFPPEFVKKTLGELGLSKKEVDWAMDVIKSGRDLDSAEDTATALNIMKKLQGMA